MIHSIHSYKGRHWGPYFTFFMTYTQYLQNPAQKFCLAANSLPLHQEDILSPGALPPPWIKCYASLRWVLDVRPRPTWIYNRQPESTNVNLHCRLDLAGGLHARKKKNNDIFTYSVLKLMLEEDWFYGAMSTLADNCKESSAAHLKVTACFNLIYIHRH